MQEVGVYIEGNKLELFGNETIEINQSVQNINDITKVFTDYSRTFNVPASKSNNRIFKHYYKADIDGGFDARTKKSAMLTLNNLTFKIGKIRLDKVNLKNNIADSYAITFFGDVVKIKDLIGDDKINELGYLEQLNHEYTGANVLEGFTNGLDLIGTYDKGVIYPLISPKRRLLYDSGTDTTDTETDVNIAPVGTNALSWRDLKPAIRLIHIIEAIEDEYGLTFSRDFFGRQEFVDLYMWLNKDEGLLQAVNTETNSLIDWSTGSQTFVDFTTDTLTESLGFVLGSFPDTLEYDITITPSVGFEDVEYSVVITNFGDTIFQLNNVTGTQNIVGVFPQPTFSNNIDLECQFFVNTNSVFNYTASMTNKLTRWNGTIPTVINATCGTAAIALTGDISMNYQLPDLKVIDFLIGVFKMFNLVPVGENDGTISVTTLNDWYAAGKIYDITKYVDAESLTVSRGKLFQQLLFNYQEPKSLLAEEFLNTNGVAYGDLEASLFDNDGEPLDGGALEIKLPFENMIYERIFDLDTNTQTTLQYGFYVNKELTPVSGEPLIFYKNELEVPLNPIAFKDETNTITNLSGNVMLPNHAVNLLDNPNFTMNWGKELSTYTYNLMENGLYKNYWEDYVTDIFSNKRRVYTLDAVLPLWLTRQLKLNDRLIINDRRYLINNNKANLTNGNYKLELVNDIYSGVTSEDTIGNIVLNIYNTTVSNQENEFTITAQANGDTIIALIDIGDGIFSSINPIALKGNGSINVTVNANVEMERRMIIRFTNNGVDTDFSITQLRRSITADNNLITADSTEVTSDAN